MPGKKGMTASVPRQGAIRSKIWQSMRIMRRFTITDLCRTTGARRDNVRKFVKNLETHGYIVQHGAFVKGRAGEYRRMCLVKDTGPAYPLAPMPKQNSNPAINPAPQPEIVDQAPDYLEDPGFDDYDAMVCGNLDATPPNFITPLTAKEQKRRDELEGLVKRHFSEWLAVSFALREIRNNQYFRTTHRTFSAYCKDVLEMGRSHVYRLIDAADVVEIVRHGGQIENVPRGGQIEWIPENERQARVLLKYKDSPQTLHSIITEAIQTAPEGKITAAHIKKTARRLQSENVQQAVTKTKQQTNQAPKIAEDFRKAFNIFLDAINIERANRYKNTDQQEVVRHVQIILEALRAEL